MGSQRNTILQYLVDTLFPTITTSNGHNFNIGLLDRGLKSFDELNDTNFPVLFVASADEQRKNVTGRDFQSVIRVVLYCGVKASNRSVQEELDKFIEDVTTVLYTDPTQGGRVAWTDIKQIVTDEGDCEPHAFFKMEVEFEYKQPGVSP